MSRTPEQRRETYQQTPQETASSELPQGRMLTYSDGDHEVQQPQQLGRDNYIDLKELIKNYSRRDEAILPQKLTELRKGMACHTKGVTRHKQMPDIHVYVVMISIEQREHKP